MTEPNWDVYRNPKNSRPGWATALIIAAVLALFAAVYGLLMGFDKGAWVFGAAIVVAVIGGILALAGVKKKTDA